MNGDPQAFRYEIEPCEAGTTTLRLYGELDMGAAPEVRKVMHLLQQGAVGKIFMDLRGLSFLDSMGLSALLEAHRTGRDRHCQVSFIRGPRSVQWVFQITKMDERVEWVQPPPSPSGEGP